MDVLTTVRMSEAKLRDRVAEITGIQADLESPSMENADVRARRLQSYVQSDLLPARQFALEALGKLGFPRSCSLRGGPPRVIQFWLKLYLNAVPR